MGFGHRGPMTIRCDSKPAIYISLNHVFHERTKHNEVDCHAVRDEIIKGVVKPYHISTKDQMADILTKALGKKEFGSFVSK